MDVTRHNPYLFRPTQPCALVDSLVGSDMATTDVGSNSRDHSYNQCIQHRSMDSHAADVPQVDIELVVVADVAHPELDAGVTFRATKLMQRYSVFIMDLRSAV